MAATSQKADDIPLSSAETVYRPSRLSFEAIMSVIYLLVKYPKALMQIIALLFKLTCSCPRQALTLACNIHTVGHFTKCLDRQKIAHVHACFLSWPACIALAIANISKRSFSIAAHARDIYVEAGAAELKINKSKFTTVCTRHGLGCLKAKLPKTLHSKLKLNYHIVDCDMAFHTNSAQTPDSCATLLAVGRLIPKKGFHNLLKAFAVVIKELPCNLQIIGDGPCRKDLELLSDEMGLSEYVHFLGWQGHDATIIHISSATALIVPSVIASDGDRDGIPNVMIEAYACRTPVIASDLESITEVAKHEHTALLVNAGDINDLASKIKLLLGNPSLQDRLNRNAYEAAYEHFNSERNIQQLVEFFKATI